MNTETDVAGLLGSFHRNLGIDSQNANRFLQSARGLALLKSAPSSTVCRISRLLPKG
jgi:hypothetical protein